jgi:1-acyl-sn-glycerol-3-phosphate acyltransferase
MTQNTSVTPSPRIKARQAKNLYEPYEPPTWFWASFRVVVRFLFAIVLNVRAIGRENVPAKGPYIIASNHLNWVDVPLIPAYIKPKVVYMAKEELFYGRSGWLVRFFGAFPVKRGEADRQSLRAADTQLKAGKVIVIFPEGTRSRTHRMAKGHIGLAMIALRSGVPVIPVAIAGSEKTLKAFRPRITITYGEPMMLTAKGDKITRGDLDAATDAVMRRIASMLPPQYRGVYGDEAIESAASGNEATTPGQM